MVAATVSDLHAVVFAGGAGQRLWPLSRRNSPKQFTPLIGSRSSIQLAVERLSRIVEPRHIYVGTNRLYAGLLREQLPAIPERNFILEPERRDVAAAVALSFFALAHDGIGGPVIFQWSDHYVRLGDALIELLNAGRALVERDRHRIVVIAEQPRFANDNLGWIEVGPERGRIDGRPYYSFGAWHYKPGRELCQQMFAQGGHVWNTGHFVTSVEFMTASFHSLAPDLAKGIEEIVSYRGTPREQARLEELYPRLPLPSPPPSFDDVFLTKIPREQALLFKADLGWVDPGNLYALKEALQGSPDATVAQGNVIHRDTHDGFIYNGTDRPVVMMGTSGVIVVQMPDVTLVLDKASVRNLGTLLEDLKTKGLDTLL
jgi:mannose-1-phosphate guanylyltransferase